MHTDSSKIDASSDSWETYLKHENQVLSFTNYRSSGPQRFRYYILEISKHGFKIDLFGPDKKTYKLEFVSRIPSVNGLSVPHLKARVSALLDTISKDMVSGEAHGYVQVRMS